MTINLSFVELSNYIKTHFNKDLNFKRISEKDLRVSYEQHILFKTIQIPVTFTIDNVAADSVTIIYNGGFGIDMIITGLMAFLKSKVPELTSILIPEEGHKIRIELSHLNQTKAIFEAVDLLDIKVHENEIQISVSLK